MLLILRVLLPMMICWKSFDHSLITLNFWEMLLIVCLVSDRDPEAWQSIQWISGLSADAK